MLCYTDANSVFIAVTVSGSTFAGLAGSLLIPLEYCVVKLSPLVISLPLNPSFWVYFCLSLFAVQ